MTTPRDTLIAELRAQIEEQDAEIDRLRTTLANVTASNKALTELDRKNTQHIQHLTDRLRHHEYRQKTRDDYDQMRTYADAFKVIDGEAESDRTAKRAKSGYDFGAASREFREKMRRY